jgi:hypothetical protein
MSDTIIQVENLSKKYIIGHQQQEKYTALRDVLANSTKSLVKKIHRLKFKIKKVPPQGAGYGKRFARKPLVSIASLYFPPQGAGNYTQIIIKKFTKRGLLGIERCFF